METENHEAFRKRKRELIEMIQGVGFEPGQGKDFYAVPEKDRFIPLIIKIREGSSATLNIRKGIRDSEETLPSSPERIVHIATVKFDDEEIVFYSDPYAKGPYYHIHTNIWDVENIVHPEVEASRRGLLRRFLRK